MSDTEIVDTVAPAQTAEVEAPAATERVGISSAARRQAKTGHAKHSKRFLGLAKSIGKNQIYEPQAAFDLVKTYATAKFDETVECIVNLGVDPRHGDQMVRGTTSLPFGTGKSRVVWAFARGDKADAAREAGADFVGAEDLVERIQKEGGASCDILVASPDMMPLVGRLGQILKAKMPNPKAGTVSPNIAQVVKDIKMATRAEYRVEKNGIVHVPIGKASYPSENLLGNFCALISALLKAKPASSKGKYLKRITITSTMSPGLNVDPVMAAKLVEKV